MIKQKFKQTEIGLIPEDWEVRKIGEFVDIKHGYAFKGEFFTDIPNGNILLTPGNFKIGGGFKKDKLKYTKEELPTDYVLKEDDILVTMTDLSKEGDTLGYSAKVPSATEEKYLHNQRIGLLKFKLKEISPNFIYWILRTKKYNFFIVGSATGSTVKHTSPDRIKQFTFGMPKKVTEQCSIAKILSDLDSKIELNEQMNKTLEQIGQAIFKHWFIDFEFPNKQGKPYKSNGGEMVDSELGEIPKTWHTYKIRDCGKVVCGKTPPTHDKNNYGSDYPFITIPDMHNQVFVTSTERKLSKQGADTQRKKELPSLTICVSCIATPGIVVLTTEPSYTNQQINSVVCNSDISPYFIYLTMKLKSEEVKLMGLGGTATLNLNTGDFERIKIITPDKKCMETFHQNIKPVFDKILNTRREIMTLSEIRDSLLPKLMSGKIRVPKK